MRVLTCRCGTIVTTATHSGPVGRCQDCRAEANRRDRRRAQARYRTTAGGKDTAHRYWQSAKGRATSARNRHAHWEDYRAQREAYQAALRVAHPERERARDLVQFYVRTGRIVKSPACDNCGAGVRLHGHHHRGYTGEAKLDVIWLCPACHYARHGEEVMPR